MRAVLHSQMTLGEEDIAKIKLDPKSRDDIPRLLAGLQHIYTTPDLRAAVFTILEEVIPRRAGSGKEGMPVKIRDALEWSSGESWYLVSCVWL